jgi:hypothetical protein
MGMASTDSKWSGTLRAICKRCHNNLIPYKHSQSGWCHESSGKHFGCPTVLEGNYPEPIIDLALITCEKMGYDMAAQGATYADNPFLHGQPFYTYDSLGGNRISAWQHGWDKYQTSPGQIKVLDSLDRLEIERG